MNKIYNISEASAYLGIAESTLYKWVHYRRIPFIKLGSRLLFAQELLDGFIRDATVYSTKDGGSNEDGLPLGAVE